MQIVVLAGGVGGSRFVQGVRRAYPEATISVVGNTADDITLHGLRICPDLDTMMYTLGGGGDDERGWGRLGESWRVLGELAAYGAEPSWFSIGDLDLGTHLVRTQMLEAGYPLTEVTQALSARWLAGDPRISLLPMSDDRVETHIVIPDPESPAGRRAVHFQEYWVRLHAVPEALEVVRVGIEAARPTAAVLAALAAADLVLVAPSNPVVSIGPILAVPGLRAALRATPAPVVGFAGILGGAPVLGMAHRLLPAIGVAVEAAAVGLHYGARGTGGSRGAGSPPPPAGRDTGGVLDLWVMDDRDAGSAGEVVRGGLAVTTTDLVMADADATAAFVRHALDRLPTGSAPAA